MTSMLQVVRELHEHQGVCKEWAAQLKNVSREGGLRLAICKDHKLCEAIREGLEQTEGSVEVLVLIASAVANLVIESGEDEEGEDQINAMWLAKNGVLGPFLRVCKISGQHSPQLEMVCSIGLGNLCRQFEGEDPLVCAWYDPLARQLMVLGLRQVCVEMICKGTTQSVRDNVVKCIAEFGTRSKILAMYFGPDCDDSTLEMLSQQYHFTTVCVDLLLAMCRFMVVSDCIGFEAFEKLHRNKIVAKLVDSIKEHPHQVDEKIVTLLEMLLKMPLVEDPNTKERNPVTDGRVEIFKSLGLIEAFLDTLSPENHPDQLAASDPRIKLTETMMWLLHKVDPSENQTQYDKSVETLLNATAKETKAMDEIMKQLSESKTQAQDTEYREKILPHAQLRKACLSLLNSLIHDAISSARVIQILDGEIVKCCFGIIHSYLNFDLDATSACLRILRILTIGHASQVISIFPTFGDELIRTVQTGKDHNSVIIAAAILRIGCKHATFLSPNSLQSLLKLIGEQLHPFAKVEIARAASYMLARAKEEEEPQVLASVLQTNQCVSVVAFLLQSEQPILHQEALEAMTKGCSSDLLHLCKSISISMGPQDNLVETPLFDRIKAIAANPNSPENVKTLALNIVKE